MIVFSPAPRRSLREHLLHDVFIHIFPATAHLLLQLYLLEVRRVKRRVEGILGRRMKAATEEEEKEEPYQTHINQIEPGDESQAGAIQRRDEVDHQQKMGAINKILRNGKNHTKGIIKFLRVCKHPRPQRDILQRSINSVNQAICNAFSNVAQNRDIRLSSRQRRKFSKHRMFIKRVISPAIKLKNKRAAIQRGGNLFMGTLLEFVIGTAISYLG